MHRDNGREVFGSNASVVIARVCIVWQAIAICQKWPDGPGRFKDAAGGRQRCRCESSLGKDPLLQLNWVWKLVEVSAWCMLKRSCPSPKRGVSDAHARCSIWRAETSDKKPLEREASMITGRGQESGCDFLPRFRAATHSSSSRLTSPEKTYSAPIPWPGLARSPGGSSPSGCSRVG